MLVETQAAHELSPFILINAELLAIPLAYSGISQEIQFTRLDALVGAIARLHEPVESAHDMFEYFVIRSGSYGHLRLGAAHFCRVDYRNVRKNVSEKQGRQLHRERLPASIELARKWAHRHLG